MDRLQYHEFRRRGDLFDTLEQPLEFDVITQVAITHQPEFALLGQRRPRLLEHAPGKEVAHHLLLVEPDGRKLAKRRGSASLADLRRSGEDGRAIADALRAGHFPAGISLGTGVVGAA